nr:hypothetical protein GCM10020093_026470 [Planobispora longispora]
MHEGEQAAERHAVQGQGEEEPESLPAPADEGPSPWEWSPSEAPPWEWSPAGVPAWECSPAPSEPVAAASSSAMARSIWGSPTT